MTTRLFLSHGLPRRISQQANHAFPLLACDEPPISDITKVLVALARTHCVVDLARIESIFSILVAANHAADRLTGPPPPLPTNFPESIPTTSEWLLIAARERASTAFPEPLGAAIDSLIADQDAGIDTPTTRQERQIVDYGLGSWFAAIVGAREDSLEFAAGRALGKLARLLVEISQAARSSMPMIRPVLLRFVTKNANEHLAERLDIAVAMACKPVPDKLPLLSFLGNAEVRSALCDACTMWRGDVARVFVGTNEFVDLATSMHEAIVAKIDSLRLFGFAKPPSVKDELERTIALARSALEADTELRSAWEIQRWGEWASVARIGRVFPVGLCLLGMARSGPAPFLRIEESIFKSRQPDGWRYYENYVDIPPDTDDLGLILRLYAHLPGDKKQQAIFTSSFELLRQTLAHEDGFPVWLRDGLAEPPSPQAPLWQGPRCIAVAAQFALGMAEAQIDGHDDLKIRAIEWICDAWEQHRERSVFHYTLPFARLLLAKLAHAFRDAPAAFHPHRLQAIATNIADEIRFVAKSHGGWDSPLATACHLAVLALRSEPFQPLPGLVYLASRQTHDGLWPAESLYLCPGKDGALDAHGAATITTGVCLDALNDIRSRLMRTS